MQIIDGDATPDEVAAIVAAVAALTASATSVDAGGDDTLDEWVHSARLQSRRSGLQRGPWRLSGRIGRRAQA
jgi:hypothetical protein